MNVKKVLIPSTCMLIVIAMSVAGCVCGNTGVTPTGVPTVTATPVVTPSPTPTPPFKAELSDWATDKDTYARGDNATGWVYVRNTGDVPIDGIDFTLVIHRSVPIIGDYQIAYNYNMTGLDIKPGKSEKVQFTQKIPAEYSGISTAGNYKFEVTAFLAGKAAGNFSKDIKVV